MIWLIDYTHYHKPIDPRLKACKQDYFRIKSYMRAQKIGPTAPVSSKVYGTGLLRLATILDRNGIEVRYLHYYDLERLLDEGAPLPKRVAFSAICPTIPMCAELARRIKESSPDTEVMVGGVHVNLNEALTRARYPIFDRLCTGYEQEAAEAIAGRPLTPVYEPYADYSLLPAPLHTYAINTFSTMGCPFHCSYCVDGMAPRFCAAKDGQIGMMKELLPPRNLIHFFDSVLGFSKEGLLRVCENLQKAEHPFLLSCDMRADLLSPPLLREMEKAGFVEIRLGMESADQNVLDRSQRTLSVNKFLEQIRMIRESSGLYVSLYSITGLPGTTRETQETTLKFCDYLFREQLVDEIKNSLYVPYPMEGVDYETRGIHLLTDDWSRYDRQSHPVFRTDLMSEDELWELYIHTAESINQSWLRGLGFATVEDVPVLDGYYREYVEENYMK
jgi:radical SAM superfamily enzyme YgiQ (UPF0313 family)